MKLKSSQRLFFSFLIMIGVFTSAVGLAVAQSEFTALDIQPDSVFQSDYKLSGDGVHQFLTTGVDPQVLTKPLTGRLPEGHRVLAFEYFCPKGLDTFQIFFGPPVTQTHSKLIRRIGMSEGWVSYSVDLGDEMKDWGRAGDYLRLDFGRKKDVRLQVRNLRLRAKNQREQQIAAEREAKKAVNDALDASLRAYLAADYKSHVQNVVVKKDRILVVCDAESIERVYLCEVRPDMDVTDLDFSGFKMPVNSHHYELQTSRYDSSSDGRYDRLLSKWVLAKKTENGFELISHARYADSVEPLYDLPEEKPTSRKGLGGFRASRGCIDDLDALDITSATVNIWITRFMHSQPASGRIEHKYNGKSYYFDRKQVEKYDTTLRETAKRNIIVAAILLVDKIENSVDPAIGRLLQHPDMDPSGIYSMPNMTTPDSVDCYAASLDFLASRYSRPDQQFGRIHHWIMHNEVDAGWVWTNMGDKTDLVFMDAYIKSMRMCSNIARSYNAHSEVFITLTHYWAWTSRPKFYPGRDLLDILLDYTQKEGDFHWALAHHPYPESLFEPKTWLDKKATFDEDTKLITFKNLKVLDDWIKRPDTQYLGKYKRTLWLSENGTNSKSYSEQDLKEQAAGFVYAWKVMNDLDGIDGFQWHNWMDNRGEGGLRIGLRRFPDDPTDPAGRKPVWYVYQAAGSDKENAVFEPYCRFFEDESRPQK